MLKVTTQGGEVKELEFVERVKTFLSTRGMVVGDALKAAGIEPKKTATITVNDVDAGLKTPVHDGDLIVITPKVSNG